MRGQGSGAEPRLREGAGRGKDQPAPVANGPRQRLSLPVLIAAARPASKRATGMRNGEQET